MNQMDDFHQQSLSNTNEPAIQNDKAPGTKEAISSEEQYRRDEEIRRARFFENYQHAGKPKLYPSYVVFADLLGVRALIMHSEGDESVLERVTAALADAAPVLESGDWSYFRYYSDCVSLITPVKFLGDPSHESEFGHTVLALGAWQALMTIRGFPVRGGFAFGNVFVDERSLFGKAHLMAYKLESEMARVPRILVCRETLRLLKTQVNFYNREYESPQERHILVDIDDKAFVSYLAAVHCYYDGKEKELLKLHRALIVDRLSKCDEHVRDKYLWMRDYHNWICDDWSRRYGRFKKFKIGHALRDFRNIRAFLEESE